jgi:dTDP-4-amino-4,6-dideoxygalactose transaminase
VEVPFLDLGTAYEELAPDLDAAYRKVMRSGRFLLGEQLESFESEFAAYSGANQCAGVGSGFDALALGLRALGVGQGDEVLVPAHTAVATWLAVVSVGAIPVGVEPVEMTHTIDPERLDAAWSSRTRAVVPVHLYGRPADMAAIVAWSRSRNLRIIADAAQAHGARIDGEGIGAMGDAVAWSFYPSKNLGAFADGGCLTSDDPEVIARVRRLRNYGAASRDEIADVGVNSRLDELQAAFLRVRLGRLDAWNARRRVIAENYLDALSDLPLILPPRDGDKKVSAWHQFVVRVADRDRVRAALASDGVETMVHYPVPPFAHPALAKTADRPVTFPIAEHLAGQVLSLPVGPHLPAAGARRVVQKLDSALAGGQPPRHAADIAAP